MPAKRRGKAVLIPSSPAYSFGSSQRPSPSAGSTPGPGTYNIHGGARHAPPKRSKAPTRAQIMDTGNVLGSTTSHPLSCNRSSPSFNFAGKPFPAGMLDKSPGPGAYNDSKKAVNPRHPTCAFAGSSVPDSRAKYPGPGKYKWGPSLDKLHPNTCEPVSMKFRHPEPGDKTRRPGPAEYSPKDRLAILKGEYTKCTMKFRPRPNLLGEYPEPGPGEYDPSVSHQKSAPNYTIRLKLAAELDPPPYPGPGSYDVESSTIGNWGAGMAAHILEPPDIFLNERIEVFRRQGDPSAEFDKFLQQNRKDLMEMRREELGHGNPNSGTKRNGFREGKSQNGVKSADSKSQGSDLLVRQHVQSSQ